MHSVDTEVYRYFVRISEKDAHMAWLGRIGVAMPNLSEYDVLLCLRDRLDPVVGMTKMRCRESLTGDLGLMTDPLRWVWP